MPSLWFVIAERRDGSQVVLEQYCTQKKALQRCAVLQRGGIDYPRIFVEFCTADNGRSVKPSALQIQGTAS